MGDPTSSYATASIALRVSGALKPNHHDTVETPSAWLRPLQLQLILHESFYNRRYLGWCTDVCKQTINKNKYIELDGRQSRLACNGEEHLSVGEITFTELTVVHLHLLSILKDYMSQFRKKFAVSGSSGIFRHQTRAWGKPRRASWKTTICWNNRKRNPYASNPGGLPLVELAAISRQDIVSFSSRVNTWFLCRRYSIQYRKQLNIVLRLCLNFN
jgi:hypothetical protein